MTDNRIVYRIENVNGFGPYRRWLGNTRYPWETEGQRKLSVDMANNHWDATHPNSSQIFSDLCMSQPEDMVCGFRNLGSLAEWFEGYLRRLHLNGYQIHEFIVPSFSVLADHYQVVFPRSEATRERVLPIRKKTFDEAYRDLVY